MVELPSDKNPKNLMILPFYLQVIHSMIVQFAHSSTKGHLNVKTLVFCGSNPFRLLISLPKFIHCTNIFVKQVGERKK